MEKSQLNNINLYLDSLSKVLNILFKLSMLVGGLCLLTYCVRIGYFPKDVGLGDGLIFLMLAACFGFIYIFFLSGLLGLGILFYPLFCAFQNIVLFVGRVINKKTNKQVENKKIKFIRPHIDSFLFGIIGLVFIFILGQSDHRVVLNLVLTSIMLALFVAIFLGLSERSKEYNKVFTSPIEHKNTISEDNARDKIFETKKGQIVIFLTALLFPLILSGTLLEGAMKIAGIRKDMTVVYLKPPFSKLIPNRLHDTTAIDLKNHSKAFKHVLVLFGGLGKKTVISFKLGEKEQKLIIPNESIFVL